MPLCTEEIIGTLSDAELFLSWKTGIQNEINTLSELRGAGADTQKNTGIMEIEKEITKHLGCVREKLEETEGTTTEILSLQTDYVQAEKEVEDAKKDVAVAKERTSLLRNPERKVTVYEGWFPIHRPLTTGSALLLIGSTLLAICLVLAYVMMQLGLFVEIGYIMKSPGLEGPFAGLLRQITPLTVGIFLISLGLLGGLIYYVRK